jgi:hypothetical protein
MVIAAQRQWGNECLKWLRGGASLSQPVDASVIEGVVRSVYFHAQHAREQLGGADDARRPIKKYQPAVLDQGRILQHGGDPEASAARMEPDPRNVDEVLSDSLERVESLATNNVPRKE